MTWARQGRRQLFWLIVGALFYQSAHAQLDIGGQPYGPKPIVEGLVVPWSIAWAGEDSIFISELDGRVSRIDVADGRIYRLLELTDLARENQSGLMGLDLHDNFPIDPFVYLSYTYYNTSSEINLRVSRFTYQNDELVDEQVLIEGLKSSSSNTGSRLMVDGDHLYFSLGDIKLREVAQDTNSENGKIHRIHLDGTVPTDNPHFPSSVWSIGHRNPQGITKIGGNIVISEHGASSNDEVNLIEKGANYGWPWVSGFCEPSNQDTCDLLDIHEPLKAWSPTVAPAGIEAYRGTKISTWSNHLLMACLKDQSLRVMKMNATADSILDETTYMEALIGRIRDVLVSPDGRVFLASSNEDVFGTPRLGGDKVFELTKDYLYEPPDLGGDTSLDELIVLDSTILQTRIIAKNLFIPWDMHWDPDGWIWFSQRDGWIKKVNPETGELVEVFFIDEVFQSPDNSGLHAMALHPRFPLVPYVFANYTTAYYDARLVRFTYSIEKQTFIDSTHLTKTIPGNNSHNGSRIVFENDSVFFFAVGDAYTSDRPQSLDEINGHIIRMTIDGEIPEDNPYPGSYTWSYGHRNPQGLTYGPNGLLYSSEHGEATDDELNLIEKGRNYGWPHVEGFCDLETEMTFCNEADVREPLTAWTPTEAPCGLAYFDHESIPEWRNSLLQVFLKDKEMKVLYLNDEGDQITREEDHLSRKNALGKNIGYYGRLRDVLVAPNGKIYVTTSNREPNGAGLGVVKEDDDKIIELFNPNYNYSSGKDTILGFGVSIFPNPTKDYVNIRLPEEGEYEISLFDRKGYRSLIDLVKPEETGTFYQFQRGQLSAGLYLLSITSKEGYQVVHKLIFY
jgi:glucose/arabinose dehydrogenase